MMKWFRDILKESLRETIAELRDEEVAPEPRELCLEEILTSDAPACLKAIHREVGCLLARGVKRDVMRIAMAEKDMDAIKRYISRHHLGIWRNLLFGIPTMETEVTGVLIRV